jgi:hypothetical protein
MPHTVAKAAQAGIGLHLDEHCAERDRPYPHWDVLEVQRIKWSQREIELLGKRPDSVVARMLGRTRYAVQLKRHSLGIPQCWENRRALMPAEDAQLGTMRDAELARKLKRSVSSVRTRRNDNTSIRFIRTPKRWSPGQPNTERLNAESRSRSRVRLAATERLALFHRPFTHRC